MRNGVSPSWPGMVALWLVRGCPPELVVKAGDWAAKEYGPDIPNEVEVMIAQIDAAIAAVTQ